MNKGCYHISGTRITNAQLTLKRVRNILPNGSVGIGHGYQDEWSTKIRESGHVPLAMNRYNIILMPMVIWD